MRAVSRNEVVLAIAFCRANAMNNSRARRFITVKLPAMKTFLTSVLAALVAVVGFAAESLPLFNATLTVGKEHRFVLVSAAGQVSSFLRLGESFDGYKLADYDAKTGTLGLERDGRVARIALVTDAAIADAQSVTPATLSDAEKVMTAMNFDVMMEKMLAQSKKSQMRMIEPMMAQLTKSDSDKKAALELQARMMDELLAALKPAELKEDMARIYSEMFSKEELNALAAFYSTPIGQKLNDRQPEVQARLNEAIMPRMMAVMPRIKKIAQDFAAEQRTKREAAGGGSAPATPPAPKP